MQPMLAEFRQVAAKIAYSVPQRKIVSSLTGQLATEEIASPEYWVEHIIAPVKFAAGMEMLQELGYEIFLEIGAKPNLLGMGRYCIAGGNQTWLPSLRPDKDDWMLMLESLAQLYVCGVTVDWEAFNRDYGYRRVELPSTPWQRRRYWIETRSEPQAAKGDSTAITDWLNQGQSEQLSQYLSRTHQLSLEEQQLLPKLLDVLIQQHQTQQTQRSIQNWLYETQWQLSPV